MRSLEFKTTPQIISEIGATARIGEMMLARGCTHIAFVTDQGILDLGLAEQALAGFKEAGLKVWTFSDVVADPPEAMGHGETDCNAAWF